MTLSRLYRSIKNTLKTLILGKEVEIHLKAVVKSCISNPLPQLLFD